MACCELKGNGYNGKLFLPWFPCGHVLKLCLNIFDCSLRVWIAGIYPAIVGYCAITNSAVETAFIYSICSLLDHSKPSSLFQTQRFKRSARIVSASSFGTHSDNPPQCYSSLLNVCCCLLYFSPYLLFALSDLEPSLFSANNCVHRLENLLVIYVDCVPTATQPSGKCM